jgi:hypothetical protein
MSWMPGNGKGTRKEQTGIQRAIDAAAASAGRKEKRKKKKKKGKTGIQRAT